MPPRKNQHYVPQHYLRGWAPHEMIGVYHLEDGEVPDTNIENVCSEDYLYGNPTHVEDALSELENIQNRPIQALRSGKRLVDLSEEEWALLLSFITTQRTRSKFTQEDIEEGDELLRKAIEEDFENDRYQEILEWKSDFDYQEKLDALVDVSVLSVHHRHMLLGLFSYQTIQDLDAVMLRNGTNREFITSDIPIVLDNPRFKDEANIAGAGMVESGLQILCPIDPHRLLLLYDKDVYSFESNSYLQTLIQSESVVSELNLLQFHNAEDIVLHRGCEVKYLNSLAERKTEVRKRRTYSEEFDVLNGETVEVEKTPPFQTPGISPTIPGQETHHHTRYREVRPTSMTNPPLEMVDRLLEEAEGFADIGLILGIRCLNEWVS